MRISYYFPTWLINMAIISELQTDLLTEQKFGLRVIRIVEDDAEIFSLVKKGDVNGLKSLFELGLAAPNIVNHSWHVPLINVSMDLDYPSCEANHIVRRAGKAC